MTADMHALFSLLKWAVTNSKIQKRLLVSVFFIVALSFAYLIPMPGIQQFPPGSVLGLSGILSGLNFSLFGLGIVPFFQSCFLVQIGSAFIPALRRWTFDDSPIARSQLLNTTYGLTLLLTTTQTFLLALSFKNAGFGNFLGSGFVIFFVVTTIASVAFLLFAAQLIKKFGVGNGVALVLVLPFFTDFFRIARDSWVLESGIITLFISLVLFAFAYFMARKTYGINMIINQQVTVPASLPFRPTVLGQVPYGFARGILLFPLTLLGFVSSSTIETIAFYTTNPFLHVILLTLLIILVAHLYVHLVFKPKILCATLERFGYKMPEGSPVTETILKQHIKKTLWVIIFFLMVVAFLQILAHQVFDVPDDVVKLLLGWPVILVGGVAADVVSQLEFYQKRETSDIGSWQVCDIVGNEWDAILKANYLKAQGIPALVEAFRYSWGAPIRTAIDEYRIHAPVAQSEKAVTFLI